MVDAAAERFSEVVQQANSQAAANTLWALGELGHCPSDSIIHKLLQADAVQVRTG